MPSTRPPTIPRGSPSARWRSIISRRAVSTCASPWAPRRPPAAFAAAASRLDAGLAPAGRARGAVRRSVEVDAALAESAEEAAAAVERFCERRNIARDHPLLDGALVGNADAVLARARAYGE